MSASLPLPLAHDHPAYAGHFPGMPIMPGVVLLDEALHAIGAALQADLSACRINAVKFLSPVTPGEPVRVDYETLDTGAIRFELVSGARKVASGSVRPLPSAARE
jgi:3-hydroxymyristoyl/3-hydroxydecanoyl-(acyl carrier protein) dehydratase